MLSDICIGVFVYYTNDWIAEEAFFQYPNDGQRLKIGQILHTQKTESFTTEQDQAGKMSLFQKG